MKTFLFGLFLSVNAFAWGPTGHRVVGAVAENHLDSAVMLKVYEILGGQSLSRVSTWPDEIKSEPQTYRYTFNWHYTDWKDEDHDHDETHSSGKLLSSIKEQIAVLKDAQASGVSKAFAIKFIVHLVGDLHMPLHVGNGLDRGGNNCRVVFHHQETNLHALWDEGMIDFTKLSFTELTDYVSQGRSQEEVELWKRGDLADWARESKDLRALIYPADLTPSEAPMSVRNYCKRDITLPRQELPQLSYEYSYKFLPALEKRLFQAGIRLAEVLNSALKQ